MLNRRTILCAWSVVLVVGLVHAVGQEPTVSTTPTEVDLAARAYVNRCTGCHTIGRGALTGPDLSRAITWPPADLRIAILRMQEKTGPIPPNDVDALIAFLKDEKRDVRIAAEEQRIAAQFAVELDPPSAEIGRALFLGHAPLENDGTACAACHQFAETPGGNLGPDLTGIVARLGRQGLMSATEKPAFKVMAPMYGAHPITKQEALHLTRFFEEVDRGAARRDTTPWLPTLLLVVLGMGCVLWFSRRHKPRVARSHGRERS